MIRGLIYWFCGLLLTLVMFIYVLATLPFSPSPQDYAHRFIRLWSGILLRVFLGVRIQVQGREHLEEGRAYIIVSNHRSYTDILIGSAAFPVQFRWLAKESLFRIPLIGVAMRMAGYVPIVREKSVSATRSLERMKEVLASRRSVWIFPEGTRTRKPKLGRFKRGAFMLAQETGVPLLPVTLVHSDEIFERPWVARPRRVSVVIGEPVRYQEHSPRKRSPRLATEQLMNQVKSIIQSEYVSHVRQPQQ